MSQVSIQYSCSPNINDAGQLTAANLAVFMQMLNGVHPQIGGVLYWPDSVYVPNISTPASGVTLSNAPNEHYEASESGGVVTIASGAGLCFGHLHISDDDEDFDIDGSPGAANATDMIVLQFTQLQQETVLARINGGAGATAVPTHTNSVWEIPLWEVELDGSGRFSALNDVRELAMPQGSMIRIAEFIGDGTVGTFTVTLPGVFRDIRIVGQALSDAAANGDSLELQFNGDTANNYFTERTVSTIATPADTGNFSGALGHIQLGSVNAANPAGAFGGPFEITIPNIKDTTLYKSAMFKTSLYGDNSAVGTMFRGFGYWQNSNALTSITINFTTGNFDTGTRIAVFGIA